LLYISMNENRIHAMEVGYMIRNLHEIQDKSEGDIDIEYVDRKNISEIIKHLECENIELRQTNAILREIVLYFVKI
jgi:hypothetical protein